MNTAEQLLTDSRFSVAETGGGIEQWMFVHEPTGRCTIVTDEEGEQPTNPDAAVTVGVYDESGEELESKHYASLREFLDSFNVPT